MPTLQIRDIPQELYDKLVNSAEINRRSLTQQAIVLLENAITEKIQKESKMAAFDRIEALQKTSPIQNLELAMEWIREDRER